MGLVAPWCVGSSCPGIEPTLPALAGRFLSTAPAEKPLERELFENGGSCYIPSNSLLCISEVEIARQ